MTDNSFIPCFICSNKEFLTGMAGFYYEGSGSKRRIKECECHKTWVKIGKLKATLVSSKIWDCMVEYDIDKDYLSLGCPISLKSIKKLKTVIASFDKSFKGMPLYVYGPLGTQKTTVSMWLGYQLIKKGKTVYFITMFELVRLLQVFDFNLSDSEKEKLTFLRDKIKKVDCLIVDESFDKTKVHLYSTGTQFPALDTFIRDRIDHERKCIVFVSNILPENIKKEGFSESIQHFVERKIRENDSLLVFKDVYEKEPRTWADIDSNIID